MRKKGFLALLASMLLVLTLAVLPFMACAAPPPPTPTEKPIELTLSTMFPESHCTNQYLHYAVAREIEEATGGRVKITIFPAGALGKAADQYDMALHGTADITQGIQGFTEGRFPLTSVVELPFLFPTGLSAEKANRAVWELYEAVPELQAEYGDVKVLAIFVNEPGNIYTHKPIHTIDDFKGMKIRSPMAIAASMLDALGASPITMPTGELYLSLDKGVVDGTLFNTANMNDWRLWEVVDYYTQASFYNLAWFSVMNLDSWNALPKDIQKIIDEHYGLNGGVTVGRGFDKDYVKNVEIAKQMGVEIYYLPDEEREKWQEATKCVYDDWVADMEARGLPGRKVLDEAQRLIRKYR